MRAVRSWRTRPLARLQQSGGSTRRMNTSPTPVTRFAQRVPTRQKTSGLIRGGRVTRVQSLDQLRGKEPDARHYVRGGELSDFIGGKVVRGPNGERFVVGAVITYHPFRGDTRAVEHCVFLFRENRVQRSAQL